MLIIRLNTNLFNLFKVSLNKALHDLLVFSFSF